MVINNNATSSKDDSDNNATAEILNPNCSEVVWRLDVPEDIIKEEIFKSLELGDEDEDEELENEYKEIYTYDTDENCLLEMIREFNGAIDDIDGVNFILIDNNTSDNIWEYVEECFKIAKKYKKKEITLSEAEKLERIAVKIKNKYYD